MRTFRLAGICLLFVLVFVQLIVAHGQTKVLQSDMRHLRNTGSREWSEFAEKADSDLRLNFAADSGATDQTLELTQYDVKLQWKVLVNDITIGSLIQDEKKTTAYFRVPAGVLKTSDNVLTIHSDDKLPDDILVGGIAIHRGSMDNLMTAALEVSIVDDSSTIVPGRITIINDRKSLQQFLVGSNENVAARPGCLYAANAVTIRIPPGSYTVYGTRGFEYGVDSTMLTVKAGDQIRYQFVVHKEVDTDGWVAADTHVHTFTYSKHGDANLRERVLTLAGEGIELPVMTDHNVYVDIKPVVDSVVSNCPAVRLTPVIGDEVTTVVGHFNVLDIPVTDALIDYRGKNWRDVGKAINSVAPGKVVILNHARDDHNNFRPFDPARHLSFVGVDRDGWKLPATAMEVINSGSQQSNYMLLFNDWFGMLNGSVNLTPIGSSDSHDVNRFIVGQGRTYVKAKDDDPGNIDIREAMRTLSNGGVLVSCGLLVKISINQKYGPGELAKAAKKATVRLDVLGPSWSRAEVVSLYMNGLKIREERILANPGQPIEQAFSWDIDLPPHDVFFAAIAEGRVGDIPFWPIAKPYQPASIEWTRRVYAGTGAVWVDGNGNGRRESANTVATELLQQYGSSLTGLFSKLRSQDESVVSQVAVLLWKDGEDLKSNKFKELLAKAPDHVRQGFGIVVKETSKLKR